MSRFWLATSGVLGALTVAAGAFGAHALKARLDERALGWYDLAVTYQFRHTLAIVACAVLMTALLDSRASHPMLSAANGLWLAGMALFCGSLYAMAFTGITRLGMITPIGGLLLIAGWLAFALGAWRAASPALS